MKEERKKKITEEDKELKKALEQVSQGTLSKEHDLSDNDNDDDSYDRGGASTSTRARGRGRARGGRGAGSRGSRGAKAPRGRGKNVVDDLDDMGEFYFLYIDCLFI